MQWMEDCIQTTSLSPNAAGTQLEEEGNGVTPLPAYHQRPLMDDHTHLPNRVIRVHAPAKQPLMDDHSHSPNLAIHVQRTYGNAPTGKTSMHRTPIQERERHARMREDVRDQYISLMSLTLRKRNSLRGHSSGEQGRAGWLALLPPTIGVPSC